MNKDQKSGNDANYTNKTIKIFENELKELCLEKYVDYILNDLKKR